MKNELQQLLQKNGYPVPKYQLVHQQGASHVPKFTVKCVVTNNMEDVVAEEIATASTKKDAEKKAAEQMLSSIRTLLQCGPLVHSTLSSGVQPQYLHKEGGELGIHMTCSSAECAVMVHSYFTRLVMLPHRGHPLQR